MEQIYLTEKHIDQFRVSLLEEEKSHATVEKYLRDIRKFQQFAADRAITKDLVLAYKRNLQEQNYAIRSINSMLAALNHFLEYTGLRECRVRQLRVQREIFCAEDKELTHGEYLRLLDAAKGKPWLQLILQAICATGIRVSELRHFTVESVRKGTVCVSCKNKHRAVLLPGKLRKRLLKYASERDAYLQPKKGHL